MSLSVLSYCFTTNFERLFLHSVSNEFNLPMLQCFNSSITYYKYCFQKRTESSIYWRCSVRSGKASCTAVVIQRGDTYEPGKRGHTHPSDPGLLNKISCSVKVYILHASFSIVYPKYPEGLCFQYSCIQYKICTTSLDQIAKGCFDEADYQY